MKNKRLAAVIIAMLAAALALAAMATFFRPPRLLANVRHEGRTYLTINPDFARRFRPDGAPAAVSPLWLPKEKPPGTRRVVMLGGSVAAGFPMTDYHLGRLLQARWNSLHPGDPMQVANLSVPGAGLRDMRRFAREAMALDPDVLVVCPDPGAANPAGAEADYSAIIGTARAHGAKVLVCLPAVNQDTPVPPAIAPDVAVVDAGRLLGGEKSADSPEFFLDDRHLAFAGRAAVAEFLVDGLDALGSGAAAPPASSAGWREKFSGIEKELRRDVMFTGYDEHDMWSLARPGPRDDGIARKIRDLQRRAVLGWDTTAIVVAYDRAALQSPRDPLVHFTAGRLLGLRGEGVRAEEAFDRGFALHPNHPEARLNYAAMQLARGKTAEARESLEVLRKFDPHAAGLAKMDAAIALREDQPARAAALLEKHLSQSSDYAAAWLMLSEAQRTLGNPEAAEQSRQRARTAGR